MTKAIIAATVLTLSIMGCGKNDETTGEQIGNAIDKGADTALDAAEQAGDKIEQWTDRPGSDPRKASAQPARERRAPANDQQNAKSP